MKKTLLLIGACFMGSLALAQVAKTPLIEHFTQASCPPCATFNPTLKNTLDNFGTANYVKVTHQTSWPGFDPMNEAFPEDPDVRRTYYGVTGVPNVSLNGGTVGAPNTVVTSSTLQSAASQTTPYLITATQNWVNAGQVNLNITVENTTNSPVSTADRLYVALLEEEITYSTAPGTNGETEFYYVMRQMYDASTGAADATGGTALGTIAANSSVSFNLSITNIPTYVRDKREIAFAVYAQNSITREVLQAAKSIGTQNIPGVIDVSANSQSVVGSGLCDLSFNPEITITNGDPFITINNAVVEYSINGSTPVQQTYSGALSFGQSAAVTFPSNTLASGNNEITHRVVSVNGGPNWVSGAAVEMPVQSVSKLNATPQNGSITAGFENTPNVALTRDTPDGIFSSDDVTEGQFTILKGSLLQRPPLGGFGNSDSSIIFDYWTIQSGQMDFVLQKVNLGSSSSLTFSHSFALYSSGSNDGLEVAISTDCGNTWSVLWNQSGSQLATAGIVGGARFFPTTAAQWRANTIDLSSYDNTNEAIVRFRGTSDYGNNLYIDDLTVTSTLSSEEIAANNAISLYPNPVSNELTVSGLDNESAFEIYNLQGALIKQGVIQPSEEISVKEFDSGVYFIRLGTMGSLRFVKN